MTVRVLRAVVAVLVVVGLVAVGALPVAVLVLSLPFLVVLARRPVLRRLAVRNAVRRPREAMLVLLGSLLGTAIITGSFVVGDTLDASLRRSAYTQLGPVDMIVPVAGAAAGREVEASLRSLPDDAVDGLLTIVTTDAAVASGDQPPVAEPSTAVLEVDFDAARRFGGDAEATGIDGPTPTGDEAVIGADLARTLDAEVGESVTAYLYGTEVPLRVVRVLPRLGIAGIHLGFGSESPNLFVAPGTLERLSAGAPGPARPPTALVTVSNEGGVIEGAERSAEVERAVTSALAGRAAAVRPVKQDLLKLAEQSGEQFTQLFTSIGFFSVIAGVLLLVNIFVMLSEERKTELGMLRAVGLRRSGLVGSFSLEGWMYALASAALGTIAGLGVGRLITVVARGIFGQGEFSLELHYAASLASVQTGFTIGFVISLLTVLGTSLRIARLNVIRAIRDLPEPEDGRRRRVLGTVVAAVAVAGGAALTAMGVAGDNPFAVLIGPALAGAGVVRLLRHLVPRRPVVSLVSVVLVTWAVAAFEVVPDAFQDADIVIFVVQGLILTFSAVALVSANQDAIGAAVRRVGGGSSSMSLRLGLAYPLARRFRTAMTLGMYALVVFTLTFITVFSHLFEGQVDDFTRKVSGGFALRVDSNGSNPVPPDAVRSLPGVRAVAEQATLNAQFRARLTDDEFIDWPVAAFDEAYVRTGPTALEERDPKYADDAAAYRAVLADPNLIVVSEFFLQDGGGPPERSLEPGETVEMRDPLTGRSRTLTVAASAESGFGNLLGYVSRPALAEVFGSSVTTNLLLVAVEGGVDPVALSASINGRFLANGAEAKAFREIVNENLSQQQQFFRLMQGYLALGLVVGIAGLGVVMVRAVRERRRQVGVLRSLGFPAAAVRRAFLLESAFVAFEGIAIGVVLANIVAWRLVGSDAFGAELPFSVPVAQLAFLVLATFAASLLATVAPAQQASKIRPAVALRITD
ncbi:MAG TPA: FtsX-like permease family protein [Acidimicrobiales bacterium]|nr:FtsX-like permease family protein [Acidimicrobiales bacterium]